MSLDPIKCFRLGSIRLKGSSFITATNIDELEITPSTTVAQTRRMFEHRIATGQKSGEDIEASTLHTTIKLGIRLVKTSQGAPAPPAEDADIVYTLEAEFGVDFLVTSTEFSDDELNDFVRRNAVHIAWPFWREHAFSTLRAASLPIVEIPLMPAVKRSQEDRANPSLTLNKP